MRGYIQIYFLCDTNYFVVCIAIILIILKTLALYNDLHVDYNILHLWGCIGESERDRGIHIDPSYSDGVYLLPIDVPLRNAHLGRS